MADGVPGLKSGHGPAPEQSTGQLSDSALLAETENTSFAEEADVGSQPHRGVPVGHQHAVQAPGAPAVQARGQLPASSLPGEARPGPEAGLGSWGPEGAGTAPWAPWAPAPGVRPVSTRSLSHGATPGKPTARCRALWEPWAVPYTGHSPALADSIAIRGLDVAPMSAPPSTQRQQGQVCGPEPLR